MKKIYRLLLNVFWLAALFTIATQQSPVFLVHPVSITAVDGTTVEFSCTANNTEEVSYRVNGTAATMQDVQDKGFVPHTAAETLIGTGLRRNLTVAVLSQYNNTEIFCRAIGTDVNVNSETANLTVQGPLSSVSDLSSLIDFSTVNISWSPPFTLPGTAITGYNISVTSNGTTTNYFTSDSYYVSQLSDITDSPCNEINITVSGYNGLNGETDSISVLSSDIGIPVKAEITSSLHLLLNITVDNLCISEHHSAIHIELSNNDTLTKRAGNVLLPQDTDTNVLTVNTTLTVLEDLRYTAVVSFSNLAGEFNIMRIINFNTFGVVSVVITDTTGGRVCLQCLFSSFSTDTGCTVELVSSSGSVQYTETFKRYSNTAEGCVSHVTTGQYDIRVYDSSSSLVVHEVTDVTVMLRSLPTTTEMSSPPTSTVATTTRETMSSNLSPPEEKSRNLTYTAVLTGVPIGFIVLLLIIVTGVILCVFLWKKITGQKKLKTESGQSNIAPVLLQDYEHVDESEYAVPLNNNNLCNVSKGIPDSGKHVHVPESEYAVPADNIKMCSVSKKMLDGTKYVEIAEIEEQDRPLPGIFPNTTVPYSMVYFEGQPPPPPYKHTTDCQVDEQILDKGVILDKSCEDSDEDEQPPPIPPRTDYSPDDHITLEQQRFKDESLYPERDEVTAF